jgi:ribonuclease HII
MTGLHGTAGIDEAGRGPMIGPMVICGVLIVSEKLSDLLRIGARDSKTLSFSTFEVERDDRTNRS